MTDDEKRKAMYADYAAYRQHLGTLTVREEGMHRRAFLSGWVACNRLAPVVLVMQPVEAVLGTIINFRLEVPDAKGLER